MEATLNNYVVIAKTSCLDIVEATRKRLAAKKSGRKNTDLKRTLVFIKQPIILFSSKFKVENNEKCYSAFQKRSKA